MTVTAATKARSKRDAEAYGHCDASPGMRAYLATSAF